MHKLLSVCRIIIIIMTCYINDYIGPYIGETKQPLQKWMAQDRRANSSSQDSAVHIHLNEKNLSMEENTVNILTSSHRGGYVKVQCCSYHMSLYY